MRKTASLLLSLVLLGASSMAFAHSCPLLMKQIDDKMATNPQLSADDAAKVKKLRAEGEAQHKAGDHDASMKSLGEAKKILGI